MYLFVLYIWSVLYALIGIGLYWNVHMCISKYSHSIHMYWHVLYIKRNGLYLYILISICMYCTYGIYC